MIKNLKIIFDLDNTLCDGQEYIAQRLSDYSDRIFAREDITRYDFWAIPEVRKALPKLMTDLLDPEFNTEFFRDLYEVAKPINHAIEAFDRILDIAVLRDIKVTLCSEYVNPAQLANKVKWVRKHLGYYPNLYLTDNKIYMLETSDIFVDDNPKFIEYFSGKEQIVYAMMAGNNFWPPLREEKWLKGKNINIINEAKEWQHLINTVLEWEEKHEQKYDSSRIEVL